MRAMIGLIMVATALGACSTTQLYWFKNGATTQDYNQDKYRCMQESTRSQYSSSPLTNLYTGKYMGQTADAGQYVDTQIFSACMQAAGWSLTDKPPVSAPPVSAPPVSAEQRQMEEVRQQRLQQQRLQTLLPGCRFTDRPTPAELTAQYPRGIIPLSVLIERGIIVCDGPPSPTGGSPESHASASRWFMWGKSHGTEWAKEWFYRGRSWYPTKEECEAAADAMIPASGPSRAAALARGERYACALDGTHP